MQFDEAVRALLSHGEGIASSGLGGAAHMAMIGALTTSDSILGGRIVSALLDVGLEVTVIVDPTPTSEREAAIHSLRTGNRLPPISLPNVERMEVKDHNLAAGLIAGAKFEMLVNAGTPHICRTPLLGAAPYGIINCHPGRLPDFRGSCAVEHAVLQGRAVANTVHVMTEGIDEGPIYAVEDVPLDRVASYEDLRVETYLSGFSLLSRTIKRIFSEGLQPSPQGEGRTYRPVSDAEMDRVIELVANAKGN